MAARVEALTQQVPGHELADVRFERRAVVAPKSARALVTVAAVVVAVVVGVMLVGKFSGGGDGAGEPAAVGLSPVGETTATAPTTVAAGQADPSPVVSVQGMVTRPGLVTVEAATRLGQLADLAGGALPGARLDGLNLAEKVVDGLQLVVDDAGSRVVYPGGAGAAATGGGEPGNAGAPPAGTGEAAGQGTAVNLNTADATALGGLPGVGPKTAEAIIAWRDAHGPFSSVEQLMEVKGIGPAKFEALRDGVTV
ncbi:ComEA family DNA-binding protein [Corynebacterium nuruki]|uniref:ComEA family DNA-binding protein n=1 Tax=Corynebacterium nuruki TaxID=1032851 RepID=UPI0002486683|nr:ComEA family DNA-binding protein [Corynebacterium nuruki]